MLVCRARSGVAYSGQSEHSCPCSAAEQGWYADPFSENLIRCNLRYFSTHQLSIGDTLSGLVHVVDDDAAFRTAIERRLKQAGYEVATYPSAQHLLDRLPSETEVGCILLDVRIPDLNGTELQDRLRELGSTLPIIFLTGYPDIRLTVQTIRAGAEDFLIKPVSSDLLLQAIERAVARHKMSRDRKPCWTWVAFKSLD